MIDFTIFLQINQAKHLNSYIKMFEERIFVSLIDITKISLKSMAYINLS